MGGEEDSDRREGRVASRSSDRRPPPLPFSQPPSTCSRLSPLTPAPLAALGAALAEPLLHLGAVRVELLLLRRRQDRPQCRLVAAPLRLELLAEPRARRAVGALALRAVGAIAAGAELLALSAHPLALLV